MKETNDGDSNGVRAAAGDAVSGADGGHGRRGAEERQYLRNAAGQALAAPRGRRHEILALLRRLTPEQWRRGRVHVTLGRMTFADWVALIAAHDDRHLAQLRRALDGRPSPDSQPAACAMVRRWPARFSRD
jgi:hypothetical protein